MSDYIPARSDIVSYLDPLTNETRKALVISPVKYNEQTGFLISCALAAQSVDYPFEVSSSAIAPYVVLSDHLQHFTWRDRSLTLIKKFPQAKTEAVLKHIELLL